MGLRIPDGFTLTGKLPARAGFHGEVNFTYRPALPERVAEFRKADRSTAARELAAEIKLLVEHLQSWEDSDPLSEETLRHMLAPDLGALIEHVLGYTSTDWSEREKNLPGAFASSVTAPK